MRYAHSSVLNKGPNPVTVRDESINCTSAEITSSLKLKIDGQQIEPKKPTTFTLPAGEFNIESPDGPASISIVWFGEPVPEKTKTLDQELAAKPEKTEEKTKEEPKPPKKAKPTDPPADVTAT